MTELHRYLHPNTDVPAGDIGVGGREIGYLYGQYKVRTLTLISMTNTDGQLFLFKRLSNQHGTGVLTGKSLLFGGSHIRPEATGYGTVYIAKLAIEDKLKRSLSGARCSVSGSGNVAQYAAQKLLHFGARVLTMSDSNGVLVFENGMTDDDWKVIVHVSAVLSFFMFGLNLYFLLLM